MDPRCADGYIVCHRNATPGRNRVTITLDEDVSVNKLLRLHENLTGDGLFNIAEQLYHNDDGKILYGFEIDVALGTCTFKRCFKMFVSEVKKELIKYPIYCHLPKGHLTVVK